MSSFNHLNKIAHQTDKDITFGYIRQYNMNTPSVIKYFCLKYYFISEYFTRHGDSIKITNYQGTNNNLDVLRVKNHALHQTAYGNYYIDTDNLNNREYIWTFKINSKLFTNLRIGLDSSNRRWRNNDFTEQYKFMDYPSLRSCIGPYYGFDVDITTTFTKVYSISFDGNKYWESSKTTINKYIQTDRKTARANIVCKMKLNTKSKSLTLTLALTGDGSTHTQSFVIKDINLMKKDTKYNLAISPAAMHTDESIRIINFVCQSSNASSWR